MRDPTPPSRAFVLGLADADGRLEAGALFDLGAAVGLSATSIRLAVRRLVDAGLVESHGRGRDAVIALTPAGLAKRAPDLGWAALAYRLDHRAAPWDHRWHLVSFSVPESARSGRDGLRDYLIELIGAPLAGGLYASHFDWRPWVRAAAARYGVADHVTTASTDSLDVGGERDPRTIAARLWPLAELGERFDAFVERWAPVLDHPPPVLADAARVVFTMSHDFEELTRRDPLLPPELAPPAWRGAEVRHLYRQALATLSRDHPTIANANVFSAYLAAITAAESMDDETFQGWFWAETNPKTPAAAAGPGRASSAR